MRMFAGCLVLVLSLGACARQTPAPRPLPQFVIDRMSLAAETMNVLDRAERFVVFSLEPLEEIPRYEHSSETDFHGYPVLGKVELTDANERAQLLGDFYQGIKNARGAIGNCFAPRHGISATLGDETVDLVICFECWTVLTFATHGRDVGVTDLPLAAFKRVLEREKIPIAD